MFSRDPFNLPVDPSMNADDARIGGSPSTCPRE
jgi:hypothetical protein